MSSYRSSKRTRQQRAKSKSTQSRGSQRRGQRKRRQQNEGNAESVQDTTIALLSTPGSLLQEVDSLSHLKHLEHFKFDDLPPSVQLRKLQADLRLMEEKENEAKKLHKETKKKLAALQRDHVRYNGNLVPLPNHLT